MIRQSQCTVAALPVDFPSVEGLRVECHSGGVPSLGAVDAHFSSKLHPRNGEDGPGIGAGQGEDVLLPVLQEPQHTSGREVGKSDRQTQKHKHMYTTQETRRPGPERLCHRSTPLNSNRSATHSKSSAVHLSEHRTQRGCEQPSPKFKERGYGSVTKQGGHQQGGQPGKGRSFRRDSLHLGRDRGRQHMQRPSEGTGLVSLQGLSKEPLCSTGGGVGADQVTGGETLSFKLLQSMLLSSASILRARDNSNGSHDIKATNLLSPTWEKYLPRARM